MILVDVDMEINAVYNERIRKEKIIVFLDFYFVFNFIFPWDKNTYVSPSVSLLCP